EIALPGGSPIKKAHATACRRAGIEGFTTHDWRHHWASWAAMSGVHPEALREEGGWQSIKSVQVYARLRTAHRAAEMAKLNVANSGHCVGTSNARVEEKAQISMGKESRWLP